MVKDQMYGKTMRKSYAKYEEILQIPNMLKIQKDSYQWFLDEGLRDVFKDVGTITDFSGKLEQKRHIIGGSKRYLNGTERQLIVSETCPLEGLLNILVIENPPMEIGICPV